MAAPVDTNATPPVNNPQPRLAPEIRERIIDHLSPYLERPTLLNEGDAESRAGLFEELALHTREQAIACARSLTQTPLLGARVRSLQIGNSKTEVTGPELASILITLAGKLPKLALLNFFDVSFEQSSMRNLAFWCLPEFSHITSLSLRNVMLPSASSFFQVVCSFPRLQSLRCYYLRWSASRSMAPPPECHRMPLTAVTYFDLYLSCFEGIGHILLCLLD
ncbi:uncharacterized protein LAESUDRAFT_154305 [Laetiporus sulphureus 93-53]|uniref:F-box domain-containing protein n=1 Tax=Laetiporus sulphureus 93-53 TaxID=1314785 RepID=A0A165HK76_9APHY|nr:uncharacterized protein LAESUDRAFT_154305 [Laetiporus sulphureus 93-53]KZT11837.1 hypothetical protein LAESUDRAFT_154305 [Laetiporus sulphureus 93-53]